MFKTVTVISIFAAIYFGILIGLELMKIVKKDIEELTIIAKNKGYIVDKK